MTVFKYAVFRNFQSPLSLFATSIVPILLMFLMPEVWTYAPASGITFLAMMMMLSSYLITGLVLEDRIDGVIIRVLVAPIRTINYIAQNLLASIIPLLIQILLLGIIGFLRYNWSIELTVGITIAFMLFAFATTAFSFCWNMFFKSKEGSRYAYMLVGAVIAVLSGIMIPNEALPNFLQDVGAIFHPYWLIRSLNSLTLYGINTDFWLYQGIVMLFAIAFLLLGGTRRTTE